MGNFDWVAANGTIVDLDDQVNTFITAGKRGTFAPVYGLMESGTPGEAGTRIDGTVTKARDLDYAFLIQDVNYEAIISWMRMLGPLFMPSAGDGKLRAKRADGSIREITCRCMGGLDMADVVRGRLKTMLTFHAPDPFWMAMSAVVDTYVTGILATFFPFFPLVLSSSEIFTDTNLDNPGDVETWPVWIIHGPGIEPVFRNLTSDKMLSLIVTLSLNEYITIDTRPGHKSVIKNDNTNLFGALSNTSSLWALASGSNSIRLEMGGADANSNVVLSFTPRYLSE